MKIYVASSWRNLLQPAIVLALRKCGHDVYDFKNPLLTCTACKGSGRQWDNGDMCECRAPGCVKGKTGVGKGFSWSSIDPNWQNWTPDEYRQALQHPLAVEGYGHDIAALKACDACVLVLPSGRSASWEFGYAMGQGKQGTVVQFDPGGTGVEPELMYREAAIVTNMNELFDAFALPGSGLEKGSTARVPRKGSIEKLIASSSLGTPEAVALRAQAPQVLVDAVLARADELAAEESFEVTFTNKTAESRTMSHAISGHVVVPPVEASALAKAAIDAGGKVFYLDSDSVITDVELPTIAKFLQPKIYPEVQPNCRACASCYLDDMDFICGHKDAGTFGKKVSVAASPEGHCGPTLKKFAQHPLRTPEGGFK